MNHSLVLTEEFALKKLWTMLGRATQDGWVIVKFWQIVARWRRKLGTHSSILAARTPWTIWKGKKLWHRKMNPQVRRYPICGWDEVVRWHHWLDGHKFEPTPGDHGGQRSLVCCSPKGFKETWLSNWTSTIINLQLSKGVGAWNIGEFLVSPKCSTFKISYI